MTFNPRQYFVLTKPPILPEAVTWQSLCGSPAQPSVDPRHRHLQQPGYFANGKKVILAPSFFPCGRVFGRGTQWVVNPRC